MRYGTLQRKIPKSAKCSTKTVRFASIDVSFISLKLILPALIDALTAPFGIVALIKPQFEAGKKTKGKKRSARQKTCTKRDCRHT
jgi:predicted rRNA methylase YqxC with S4 and FtsJ domains